MEDIAKENKKSLFCYSCGIDCTRVRYHFAKSTPSAAGAASSKVQYDVCPVCWQAHRYPEKQNARDYVKLEDEDYTRVPDRDAPWSDKETLLLLEALEEDPDDWNKISDYVGTRTREECVIKFLSMEIEDKYLENEPDTFAALDAGRMPLNQVDNPVMSVVGFLAGMADPGVAAAAAGRWVDETRKSLQQRLENGTRGENNTEATATVESKGKAPLTVKPDQTKTPDAMDVDQPSDTNAITLHDTARHNSSLPTIALAASAARASALASNEERQHTQLVSAALNSSLQKIDLKLKQFGEMEEVIEVQRKDLEEGRRELFVERATFMKRIMEVEAQLTGLGIGAVAGMEAGSGEKMGFVHDRIGSDEPMEADTPGVKVFAST